MTEIEGIQWIQSTSHPQHPLKTLFKNTHFRCDFCRTTGHGLRHHCATCNVTLHDGCAALPTTLPANFYLHLNHPLHLKTTKPSLLSFKDCLLCGHSIRGASYKCKICDDVVFHPLCTRLAERVAGHVLHPIHPLRLEDPVGSSECDACGKKCRKWRYRCAICDVHIHVECLAKGVEALNERRASKARAREKSKGYVLDYLMEV